MAEIYKIFLTSTLTIIGGVLVFTLSQIISKFFIEPIHKQAEIIGEISDALVYYARECASPGSLPRRMLDEAHQRLRQLSSLLLARSYIIKWYCLWESLRFVPKLTSIEETARELIGLSNSVYGKPEDGLMNYERVKKIRKLLGIPTQE